MSRTFHKNTLYGLGAVLLMALILPTSGCMTSPYNNQCMRALTRRSPSRAGYTLRTLWSRSTHRGGYNALIEEQRELEKNDHGNRKRYERRRNELRAEFIEIVTGMLSEEQAQQFQNLPEFARKPDGPSHMSTNVAMPPGFIPGEAEAFHDAPRLQSEG